MNGSALLNKENESKLDAIIAYCAYIKQSGGTWASAAHIQVAVIDARLWNSSSMNKLFRPGSSAG